MTSFAAWVEQLRLEESPEVGARALLKRLRQGMAWLRREERDLPLGGPRVKRYLGALEGWDAMDRALRELYGYQGCVMGDGRRCPDDAPVACRHCGETNVPHWIEERRDEEGQ